MYKNLFLSFLLAAISQACYGAYKCGNTYSQTPCAPDAEKLGIQSAPISGGRSAPEASQELIEQNTKFCERILREVPAWKDRESLKLSPVKRLPKTIVTTINGQRREVIVYSANINAKNSYGAYQGEKFAACFFGIKDEKYIDYLVGS